MIPYKDSGIFRIKSIDEIMQSLEDHQIQLSAMKATRFDKLTCFKRNSMGYYV